MDDRVTFGAAPSLGVSTFTIETWFRRDGTGGSTSTGTGGVTAIPLVTKGRSENDNSNVDMNYFLGISPVTSGATANVLMVDFEVRPNRQPVPEAKRKAILASPGFGKTFTDHMVTLRWSAGRFGWSMHLPSASNFQP